MKKAKQTTLFQSWSSVQGPKLVLTSHGSRGSRAGGPNIGCQVQSIDLCGDEDDEDLLLAVAMEESMEDLVAADVHHSTRVCAPRVQPGSSGLQQDPSSYKGQAGRKSPPVSHYLKQPRISNSLFQTIGGDKRETCAGNEQSLLQERTANYQPDPDANEERTVQEVLASMPSTLDTSGIERIPGFDLNAGRLWIYPTNYPIRDYQFSIVQEALYKNTMVVLPTGLGKTFIAAVVMYNFYLWYPQGKVVFMAPTKPLVAQQIEACYNIMGIPQGDTAEMTGMRHIAFYLILTIIYSPVCPSAQRMITYGHNQHKCVFFCP